MSIRRIDVGPRMSDVVIHNDTIHLSGLVGEGNGVAEQARDILAKVDRLLAKAGSDKSKLLQAVIWLTDISTFDEMNSVWEAWIDKQNPPARATSAAVAAWSKPGRNEETRCTAASWPSGPSSRSQIRPGGDAVPSCRTGS